LLFRDLEVEQEGMFIYYGLTFVCNILFIFPYSRRCQ
jgi:hypothetical protein